MLELAAAREARRRRQQEHQRAEPLALARRPPDEVGKLMDLFVQYLQKELRDLQTAGIRLRVIGDRTPLGPELCQWIEQAMAFNNAVSPVSHK